MNHRLLIILIIFFACNESSVKQQIKSKSQAKVKAIKDTIHAESSTKQNIKPIDTNDTTIYGVKIEVRNKNIQSIINGFKDMDIKEISQLVSYPFERPFPIPPINNEIEFQKRFHQIFDSYLIDPVKKSTLEDWHEDDYGIWLFFVEEDGWNRLYQLNHHGLIEDIGHTSSREKKYRGELIEKEKMILHHSLKEYETPHVKIKTDDYLVRIDQLKGEKYRYASWKIGEKESSRPDLIISNGEEIIEDGGLRIVFHNKEYSYDVKHNFIGGRYTPEYSLTVKKGEDLIFIQGGVSNHQNSFENLEEIEKDLKSFIMNSDLTAKKLLDKFKNFKLHENDQVTKELKAITIKYNLKEYELFLVVVRIENQLS